MKQLLPNRQEAAAEQIACRKLCLELLESLFWLLSVKNCSILGHTPRYMRLRTAIVTPKGGTCNVPLIRGVIIPQ